MAAESLDCILCRTQLRSPVINETKLWRTALNRNQNLLGKLIVVLCRHEEAIMELTEEEWTGLQGEITRATRRLSTAFAPDHFNYAFLQNQDRHVHLHVIPRYAGPRIFAGSEFTDGGWPGHYELGPGNLVDSETMRSPWLSQTSTPLRTSARARNRGPALTTGWRLTEGPYQPSDDPSTR